MNRTTTPGSAANCCRQAASLSTATPGAFGTISAADFRLHLENMKEVGGSPHGFEGNHLIPANQIHVHGNVVIGGGRLESAAHPAKEKYFGSRIGWDYGVVQHRIEAVDTNQLLRLGIRQRPE